MLIYVDKKKERQQKIKIFCLIFFIIFFIGINIWYYNYARHHGQEELSDYNSIKYQNTWYEKASPIYLFQNRQGNTDIFVIPPTLTKENLLILAGSLTLFPKKHYTLAFTDEVQDQDFLAALIETSLPKEVVDTATTNILLTTDLKNIQDAINNEKLYPKIISYAKIRKLPVSAAINNLLNMKFPPQEEPSSTIEKEQKNLSDFVTENKKELFDFILNGKQPDFSKQNIFLKNIRLCLQNADKIHCSMKENISFTQNLKEALNNFTAEQKPTKLILLSSNQKIQKTAILELKNDEGLYLQFKKRTAYLLPKDIIALTKQKEPLTILKEKAGLNPDYDTPQMEIYKFKVMEVNLDEEI